ncbi:unnamed protein product, partial [Allacma fusca]
IGLPSV